MSNYLSEAIQKVLHATDVKILMLNRPSTVCCAAQHHTAEIRLSACWNKRAISIICIGIEGCNSGFQIVTVTQIRFLFRLHPLLFNARLLLRHPRVSFTEYLHPAFLYSELNGVSLRPQGKRKKLPAAFRKLAIQTDIFKTECHHSSSRHTYTDRHERFMQQLKQLLRFENPVPLG